VQHVFTGRQRQSSPGREQHECLEQKAKGPGEDQPTAEMGDAGFGLGNFAGSVLKSAG
jgi:hypothetical protein